MFKQTLKDLRAIAKGQKIKYYWKMHKAILVDILRDMGEEILDDKPTPKKCPHGRKKYICKECDGGGICIHNKQKYGCKICRSIHIQQEVDRWISEYEKNMYLI